MGLTVNQMPQLYSPAFNEQIFQATSTNYTQPNFTYTVKITDVDSGITETYQIPPDPAQFACVFDAGPFIKSFIDHFIDLTNTGGWMKCVDAVKKCRVNIGETYGAGTPTYHAGSDYDYYVWNGIVDFIEYANYLYYNYAYNATTFNYVYFAGVIEDKTFTDRANWLYVLNEFAGSPIKAIRVVTFDKTGAQLGQSIIKNPLVAFSTYDKGYIGIDVGYKGLTAIGAGLVTSTYPIITPSVAKWKIYDVDAISFQSETCSMSGFLSITFTVDPGLTLGESFDFVITTPGSTGAPADGTATVTNVTGGGVYATSITCNIVASDITGGTIYVNPRYIKSLTMGCENRYTIKTIHYLAKNGAFQTCNFDMISDVVLDKSIQTYKINPNVLTSVVYQYLRSSAVERDLNTVSQKKITLSTDWLTDDQVTKYIDCFMSPLSILDEGGLLYSSVRQATTHYVDLPKYKEKLRQLIFDYLYTHHNATQDV